MTTRCSFCSAPVPAEKRDCQACGTDNGAPNVRAAQSDAETQALALRLERARVSADARGCLPQLDDFQNTVAQSNAVIARTLDVLQDLIDGDATYTSYHRQLASGARQAQDNSWDRTRTQVDAALFPNYYSDIVFAALSLDDGGLSGYGSYIMTLKEALISRRASVFEANAYDLVEKYRWLLTKPIPAGFRATWEDRGKLAAAKLQTEITSQTTNVEYPSILMKNRGGTGNSDYVEVHIFGPLNKYTIDKVIGPTPRTREDRLIAQRISRKIAALGGTMELK